MSPGRASLIASAIALRRSGSTVYFTPVFCSPTSASLMMAQRIFAARIVGGEHDEIAAPPGGLAHQRTLGAVAVAAATEHSDDSPRTSVARDELARQSSEIAQRVVGVSVVDDDGEGLAAIDALKSSGDMGQSTRFPSTIASRIAAARITGGRCSENVVDIHAADERREDRNLFLRRDHIEARAARRDVDILRVKVAALPAIGQHHRTLLAAELGQLRAIFIVEIRDAARGASVPHPSKRTRLAAKYSSIVL